MAGAYSVKPESKGNLKWVIGLIMGAAIPTIGMIVYLSRVPSGEKFDEANIRSIRTEGRVDTLSQSVDQVRFHQDKQDTQSDQRAKELNDKLDRILVRVHH